MVCRVGGKEKQKRNGRWCVGRERTLQVGIRWAVEIMEEVEGDKKGE